MRCGKDGSAIVPSPPFGRTTPASRRPHPAQRPHGRGLAPFRVSFPISYEHSCEAEGGRDDRGVPDHAESTLSRAHKCSSRGVRFFFFYYLGTGQALSHTHSPHAHATCTCMHVHVHAHVMQMWVRERTAQLGSRAQAARASPCSSTHNSQPGPPAPDNCRIPSEVSRNNHQRARSTLLSTYCRAVVVAEDLTIVAMNPLLKSHEPEREYIREGKLHRHELAWALKKARRRASAQRRPLRSALRIATAYMCICWSIE